MLVSASWVYYGLDGMHFTDITCATQQRQAALDSVLGLLQFGWSTLSGVTYVRVNFLGLPRKKDSGVVQALHIEVRYPSLNLTQLRGTIGGMPITDECSWFIL